MNAKYIEEILKKFESLKVLIIGDVMLDSYIFGKVERISPEAPVPVVNLQKTENRLGGAANVAMNIVSLGAQATICSLIGNDTEGQIIESLFREKNISVTGLLKVADKPTTVKTRVIGNNHQLLRIDREITDEPSEATEQKFIELIKEIISDFQVVIFSDYDKGSLTQKIIQETIQVAGEKNIPTVVDPKRKHFSDYKNVTLFKPNLKELAEGLKTAAIVPNQVSVSAAVEELYQMLHNKYSMITLSEHGMMIYNHTDKKYIHQPAHVRNIADVSGAGDTVVSVASLCLALQMPPEEIIYLSNLAGGLVCEEVGVVPISREKLLEGVLN